MLAQQLAGANIHWHPLLCRSRRASSYTRLKPSAGVHTENSSVCVPLSGDQLAQRSAALFLTSFYLYLSGEEDTHIQAVPGGRRD